MAYGTAGAGNWTAATAASRSRSRQHRYQRRGHLRHDLGEQRLRRSRLLRVLNPTHPAAGVAHNFVYVLPVARRARCDLRRRSEHAPGHGRRGPVQRDDDRAHLQHGTVVRRRHQRPESAVRDVHDHELVPWVTANLFTTGAEQNWLIGFSKSGNGGQDLILKHPDVFTLAASWDFPGRRVSSNSIAPDPGLRQLRGQLRTLTSAFAGAATPPVQNAEPDLDWRQNQCMQDVTDYNARLTSAGILHTTGWSAIQRPYLGERWVPAGHGRSLSGQPERAARALTRSWRLPGAATPAGSYWPLASRPSTT